MKTFKQFSEEMREAERNLTLEADGFGQYVKKKRKKKEKSFLDDREAKIELLKKRSGQGGKKKLWPGLE